MNDMIGLFTAMYKDVYGLSGAHTSEKDIAYLSRRVEGEGMSFLTITLPTFADALLTGLSQGMFPHSMVTGFARDRGKSLPKFLKGLTRKIFDIESGVLLSDPCVNSIYGIRQLCSTIKKIELVCTKERINNAYQRYLDTDSEVVPLRSINKIDQEGLRKTFNTIFRKSASRANREVHDGLLHPRYSGGAVAERLNENEKFSADWYCRLDHFLPPDQFLVPNLGANGELDKRKMIPVGHESPARVTHVPKTLKTPRLIAVEPTCIQYAQQALMESLYRNILATNVGRRSVNFRDQTINAKKALLGSEDGSIATIDLSEASDRVSAGLVSYLFKDYSHLREALFRARSSRVSLPKHGVIRIRKFASMGSATCFPVETMVFMAIATYGIVLHDRQGWSEDVIRRSAAKVTVFGDDITVPNDYAPSVMAALEYFGLKVNRDKSFYEGLFRESCGTDAYAGVNVTPTYVRSLFPSSQEDAGEAVSSVSLANQLFAAGLWNASEFVRRKVERALKVRLPIVLDTSPGLGLHIPWRSYYDQQRHNDELHRPEVRTFSVQNVQEKTELGDVESYIKAFLRLQGRRWDSYGSYGGLQVDPLDSAIQADQEGIPRIPTNAILSGTHCCVSGKIPSQLLFNSRPNDLPGNDNATWRPTTNVEGRGLSFENPRTLGKLDGLRHMAGIPRANLGGKLFEDLMVQTKRHAFRLKRGWYVPY